MYWQARTGEALPDGAVLCGVDFQGNFCQFAGELPSGAEQMRWEVARGRCANDWMSSLSKIQREKLVLSRYVDVRLVSGEFDPLTLLSKLTPNCYKWAVPVDSGAIFLGASPERLFSLQKDRLFTEAVAGTRPSGEANGLELLNSEKDRWEQGLVTKGIVEALAPYCDEVKVGQVGLLSRARWQHLYTPIEAHGVRAPAETLLKALHPTPAVGGYPREGAQREIRELEGYDREWYAGAIGWIGEDAAEFSVGIRSARWDGEHLRIYAGAGIVEGSDPQSEWDETELKLSQWKSVLQIETSPQPVLS